MPRRLATPTTPADLNGRRHHGQHQRLRNQHRRGRYGAGRTGAEDASVVGRNDDDCCELTMRTDLDVPRAVSATRSETSVPGDGPYCNARLM